MSSNDIVRLFPDIDGNIDINDSFWIIRRPWHKFTTIEIGVAISRFSSIPAISVDEIALREAILLSNSALLEAISNGSYKLKSAIDVKNDKLTGAIISQKEN